MKINKLNKLKENGKDMKFKKGDTPWNKGINMWEGKEHPRGMLGKSLSEGHKEKLSKANKGRIVSEETRKKRSNTRKELFKYGILKSSMQGKHHSEETRKKLSLALKGRKMDEIWRKNLSESKIGFKHIEESKKKISNKLKGHITSKETREKISKSNSIAQKKWWKENNPSEEQLKFLKKGIKERCPTCGIIVYDKNRNHDCEKILSKSKERIKYIVTPIQDTSIEIKIQNLLTKLHLEYIAHKYMSEINHAYQCDIFIPKQETEGIIIKQKTIIECDGDYWHFNPSKYSLYSKRYNKKTKIIETAEEVWKRDKVRTKELEEKGFKVIRLWENEIRPMTIKQFEERLK